MADAEAVDQADMPDGMQISEPVFGILTSVLGFRQVPPRGLNQIRSAWSLVTRTWTLKRMFVLAATI